MDNVFLKDEEENMDCAPSEADSSHNTGSVLWERETDAPVLHPWECVETCLTDESNGEEQDLQPAELPLNLSMSKGWYPGECVKVCSTTGPVDNPENENEHNAEVQNLEVTESPLDLSKASQRCTHPDNETPSTSRENQPESSVTNKTVKSCRSAKKFTIVKKTKGDGTEERTYECDLCQRKFRKKCAVTMHYKRVHLKLKPHQCDQCQKSLATKFELKQHTLSIHTPVEKPYECDICQKSFVRKLELNEHKNIHSGLKPYKCEKCGKSFHKKKSLNSHKIIHSDVKGHKCEQCPKSFKRKQELKLHTRIHTGEKPYVCDQCHEAYSFRKHLISHVRLSHPTVDP